MRYVATNTILGLSLWKSGIGEDGGGVRLMYALEGQGVSLREEITVSSQSGTKLVGVFGKSARPVRAEDLCRQARPNPQGNQLERGRGRL
ncbi:MAG: hypothetical protein CCU26_18670 [Nitrospira sp. UW-LDO-01]|nr:MAG: hypothetical protein CCU26_18670 [Nitrospira sp. UW-LDO-01]